MVLVPPTFGARTGSVRFWFLLLQCGFVTLRTLSELTQGPDGLKGTISGPGEGLGEVNQSLRCMDSLGVMAVPDWSSNIRLWSGL